MNHLDCSSFIIVIVQKKGDEEDEGKVFFPAAFFFLFVPAYNHFSALCIEEEKKEKNECNSIVKLSAV
jgi:hypothetical protein